MKADRRLLKFLYNWRGLQNFCQLKIRTLQLAKVNAFDEQLAVSLMKSFLTKKWIIILCLPRLVIFTYFAKPSFKT